MAHNITITITRITFMHIHEFLRNFHVKINNAYHKRPKPTSDWLSAIKQLIWIFSSVVGYSRPLIMGLCHTCDVVESDLYFKINHGEKDTQL